MLLLELLDGTAADAVAAESCSKSDNPDNGAGFAAVATAADTGVAVYAAGEPAAAPEEFRAACFVCGACNTQTSANAEIDHGLAIDSILMPTIDSLSLDCPMQSHDQAVRDASASYSELSRARHTCDTPVLSCAACWDVRWRRLAIPAHTVVFGSAAPHLQRCCSEPACCYTCCWCSAAAGLPKEPHAIGSYLHEPNTKFHSAFSRPLDVSTWNRSAVASDGKPGTSRWRWTPMADLA